MGRCSRPRYAVSVHSSWRTFFAAALATTAVVAAFGAPSALGAPREIAYRCGSDICLLDPDNPSAVTNLTNNGNTSLEETPVFSPDGAKLAFISRLNGTRNIYVMNPNATAGEGIGVALQVTHYTDNEFLGKRCGRRTGARSRSSAGRAKATAASSSPPRMGPPHASDDRRTR